MKLANQICVVALIVLGVVAFERGCDVPGVVPVGPVGELHGYVLGVHDLGKLMPGEQQDIVDGVDIRKWMDEHGLKGHYRFTSPKQHFGPDESAFQKLIDSPRAADAWFYAGDYSGPMPANVNDAESIIAEHCR